MIARAVSGRAHKEFLDLLHRSIHAVLLAAVRQRKLRRERLDGVWAYLSNDPAAGAAQWQARRELRLVARAAATLNPAVIIEALLMLVRHPGASPAPVSPAAAEPDAADSTAGGDCGAQALRTRAGGHEGDLAG